ncbi:YagK/YfjJ domain-containing protein [Aeromonas sanarellii]
MFNTVRLLDILTLSRKLQHTTFPVVIVAYTPIRELHIDLDYSNGPLSTCLFNVLDTVCDYFYCHTEISSAHPTIELFLTYMRAVPRLHLAKMVSLNSQTAHRLADAINNALEAFLSELKSQSHRKRLNNLRRVEKRNQRSIATYINSLFAQHAKLLFIRLDIGYREAHYHRLTVDNTSDNLRHYLSVIQRRFKHLVGYIWKIEYGADRRFHFHLTFIFNGAEHQQDISLGRLLGEQWETITDGQGNYYNCNSRRVQYQEWGTDGIGMVHYADTGKQDLLLSALGYLTKPDEQILATLPAGRRTFGRMEISVARPRGGRPRSVSYGRCE